MLIRTTRILSALTLYLSLAVTVAEAGLRVRVLTKGHMRPSKKLSLHVYLRVYRINCNKRCNTNSMCRECKVTATLL